MSGCGTLVLAAVFTFIGIILAVVTIAFPLLGWSLIALGVLAYGFSGGEKPDPFIDR